MTGEEKERRRAEPVAASLWKAMEEIKHERGQEKKNSADESKTEC